MTVKLRAFQAHVFQALAHPTRIAIVEALRNGDVIASALPGQLQIEAADVSAHLTVLRAQQLVQVRQREHQVYYSLGDPVLLRAVDLLTEYFYARTGQAKIGPAEGDSER